MTELAGLKVLVVEDEAMVAMLIEDMLEDLGCTVVGSIASLAKACDAAATADMDVAMLDMNIAGQKVFPVAEILRERRIPFLFSSGYGEAGLPAEYSASQVVPKPFSQDSLKDKLVRALQGKGAPA